MAEPSARPLINDSALAILDVLDEPKTRPEIIESSDVTQATVYRWVPRLVELGLVESPGVDLEDVLRPGAAKQVYVRTVDSLKVQLDGELPPPDEIAIRRGGRHG